MARHQVLQHRPARCASAIPHPFLPTSPKDPIPCVTGHRAGSAFSRPPLPRRLSRARDTSPASRCRACRRSVSMHDSSSISTTRPPPKHPYPSTTSSTSPPSIGTTLPQRNNSNSSVPQRNNANSSVDKPSRCIPTMQVNYTHRYALRSPSIDTMRFFLDLLADGLSHSHSLLCFLSHKQEQS